MSDHDNPSPPGNPLIDHAAKVDFESALRKGYWRSVFSWFTRSDNSLMPFDEIRRNLPALGQHDIGMREIPVEAIVGSVGRYQDFDRAFLPLQVHTRRRWENIDKAHLMDVTLPPIEVYKIGSVYFVRDGNHRVSVARERGQSFIDAFVTEINVSFQVAEHTNIDELIRLSEEAAFEEKTHLHILRPGADVRFTLPGGSGRLLEHIDVHRYYMGKERKAEITYEEAVANWYDDVYLPLVRVIRHLKILDDFPGRSEADLYLWIIEHLYYLREEYRAEVSLEEAAAHFADEFAPRPFARWLHFLRRVIGNAAPGD